MTYRGFKPILGLAIAAGLFISLSLPTALLAKGGDDKKDKETKQNPNDGSSNDKNDNAKDKNLGNGNNGNNGNNDTKNAESTSGTGSNTESDSTPSDWANPGNEGDHGPQNIYYTWGRLPHWGPGDGLHGRLKAQISKRIFDGIRDHRDKGRQDHKITICHKGQEISIAMSALHAHLAHGDTIGSCDVTPNKNK